MMAINLDDSSTFAHLKGLYSDDDAYTNQCDIGDVVGWHCTRLIDESEMAQGMVPLNVTERIKLVRKQLQNAQISASGLADFDRVCQGALDKRRMNSRQGKIWFCLNKSLTRQRGCEDFFAHYGGEVLYRLYPRHDESEAICLLRAMGRPAIVSCRIPFRTLSLLGRCNVVRFVNRPSSELCEGYSVAPLPRESIMGFEWL